MIEAAEENVAKISNLRNDPRIVKFFQKMQDFAQHINVRKMSQIQVQSETAISCNYILDMWNRIAKLNLTKVLQKLSML